MTLLELNRAVCEQVKEATLNSGTGAELIAEDVSRPIIRPSVKVELEDGTDAAMALDVLEQAVTFRIYFYASDMHQPKLDNLAMREALSDTFRRGVETPEGTIPIDDGLSFSVTDGVLVATLDVLLDQVNEDEPGTIDVMEQLEPRLEAY